MSLGRKLTMSFGLFLVAFFCAMMFILFFYGTNEMEARGKENLGLIANQMVQQFDHLVRPMDFIIINLISTGNFINSMNSLVTIPRDIPGNEFFVTQASRLIHSALSNDSINRGFYKVNVFNDVGDVFTSGVIRSDLGFNEDAIFNKLGDAFEVTSLGNQLFLMPPHKDTWNDVDGSHIFSMVRAINWGNQSIGYIEVQHLESTLEQIFRVPEYMGIRALLVSYDGRIFYKHGFDTYAQAHAFIDGQPVSGFIHVTQNTPFTGFTLHLFQESRMLMTPLTGVLGLSGFMVFTLLLLSAVFAFALHRQIIKPIRHLRGQMETLELETLQDAVPIATPVNDLRALEETFALMRERLSDAITGKLLSQEMQMQANFDALQLQINPHFFYNVLHVISQKGVAIGDTEICEICASLASMMRYSASTIARVATLNEELAHVGAYVSLMQKRYEGRITYTASVDEPSSKDEPSSVDEAIGCFEMPKIILLQFVENAINHSFHAGRKTVRVSVHCKKIDDGICIEISDDGVGFSDEVLVKLKGDIEGLSHTILNQNAEFGIGGMGTLNTCARLWLFYKGSVTFDMRNHPDGGAVVQIHILLREDMQDGQMVDGKLRIINPFTHFLQS